MIPNTPIPILISIIIVIFTIRFISKTSLLYILKKYHKSFLDRCYAHQFFRVEEFNENFQENQLYRKVSTYVSSLASIEDSDHAILFSGAKSNEIVLNLDSNQTVVDNFLGSRVSWKKVETNGSKAFELKIRRKDKRRILKSYLQHIHTVSDEIDQRRKEIRLYINCESAVRDNVRWRSIPFSHPSTFDTVVIESELKNKVKADLESFLKSKNYYNRLGHVWKRSYLLYGPSGTGKSSFVAAMANFLSYDVYDVDLSTISDDSDLKLLLLQTKNKSIIVIEDLDRLWTEKSPSPSQSAAAVSLSAVLSVMDSILWSCGEERLIIFTMNTNENEIIDPSILKPGRIDMHVKFTNCDFDAFKTLANSHLGVKEHKLFPQVEELFQNGGAESLSAAAIGEIMVANRNSPSRAIKSVITALQTSGDGKRSGRPPRLTESGSTRSSDESGDPGGVICRESVHTVREFRKLYGLLRLRSSRKESLDLGSAESPAVVG